MELTSSNADTITEYEVMTNADLRSFFNRVKAENQRMEDYVVPSDSLFMEDDGTITLQNAPSADLTDEEIQAQWGGGLDAAAIQTIRENRQDFGFYRLPLFDAQLAAKLGIPKRYYDRLALDSPAMLARNVNHWTGHPTEERNFLLRTLRPDSPHGGLGMARALLSDKYLLLNNYDVALTALQTINEMGIEVEIKRCDLTERTMYMRVDAPSIRIDGSDMLTWRRPDDGRGGQFIYAGLVFSNSEVGTGSFLCTPRPFADCCMNCFTIKEDRLSRVHLGSKLDQGAVIASTKTQEANIALIKAQLEDAIRTFFSVEYLQSLSTRIMFEMGGAKKLEHPEKAVRNMATFCNLDEEAADALVDSFIKSGDTRRIGALQTLTFELQKVGDKDPERMYGMEEQVSDVLKNMPRFDVADLITN